MKRSVAIVCAVSILGAGCTGDGPPVPAVEAISAATTQAGSARMSMEMTTSLGDAGSTRVVMEGVMTFGGTLEEVEGELEGRAEIPGGGSGLEGAMRMVDGRLFVSGFFAQSFGSTADGWVEVGGDQRDAFAQLGGGGVDPTDPTALLSSLEAATDLRTVGSETIRGESTRHLRAEATYLELMEAQDVDIRERLETQERVTGQDLPDDLADAMVDAMRDLPVELDLWVDDEDRVRRTRMTMDLEPLMVASAGAGGQLPPGLDEATMTMTFEVYDYGVPVDVQVPEDAEELTPTWSPAEDVDLPGMAGASGPATLVVGDGPWAGRYEGEGTCRTTDLGQGTELDVHLQAASSDASANLNLRTPFEDGAQRSTSFTLRGDDGQHQSGTADAIVSIGPATERGAREFLDVDFEGTIEGWDLHGSVRCRPDEEG